MSFLLTGRLSCCGANLIFAASFTLRGHEAISYHFLGFCFFKYKIWSLVRCSLSIFFASAAGRRRRSNDTFYWNSKESFRVQKWQDLYTKCFKQINYFLCCLSVQCLLLNFFAADCRKWLPSKNIFNFYSSPVYLLSKPIFRNSYGLDWVNLSDPAFAKLTRQEGQTRRKNIGIFLQDITTGQLRYGEKTKHKNWLLSRLRAAKWV